MTLHTTTTTHHTPLSPTQTQSRQYLSFNLPHFYQKLVVRLRFPPVSWGTQSPLLGQAANPIIPAILSLTAWPIRGDCVPQENVVNLNLTALIKEMLLWQYLTDTNCHIDICPRYIYPYQKYHSYYWPEYNQILTFSTNKLKKNSTLRFA